MNKIDIIKDFKKGRVDISNVVIPKTILKVIWTKELDLGFELTLNENKNHKIYLINPSICKTHLYFRILRIDYSKEFIVSNWDRSITDIGLLDLKNGNLKVIKPDFKKIRNIEDLRIFEYDKRLWFIGFCRLDSNHFMETYIGYFNSDYNNIDKIVYNIRSNNNHVKNIMPLIHGQLLYLIDVYTGKIYKYSKDLCTFEELYILLDKTILKQTNLDINENSDYKMYGSTKFIYLNDTIYGAFVHYFVLFNNYSRLYIYNWIEIDVSNFKIIFISKPFIIDLTQVFITDIKKMPNNIIEFMWSRYDEVSHISHTTLEYLRNV
jgi:hypothetical protein